MTAPMLLMFAATAACGHPTGREGNSLPTSIPARDGNVAIQEELDAARRARTLDAYDLFLARHPGHPLTETARREREALRRRR